MAKYLKLFDNLSDFQKYMFVDNNIFDSVLTGGGGVNLPNVSLCNSENHLYFFSKPFYLTPKEVAEYFYDFIVSFQNKCFAKRDLLPQNISFIEYQNNCEIKLSKQLMKIYQKTELRIRNIWFSECTGNLTIQLYLGDIPFGSTIAIDFNAFIDVTATISFGNNKQGAADVTLNKLGEWNNNDVFYISGIEQTAGPDEIDDETTEKLFCRNIAFLLPKSTTSIPSDTSFDSIFQTVYDDGNGGYTTTKPASFDISMIWGTIGINPESFSMAINGREIDSQVLNAQRDNILKTLRGDFSALSALDDTKIALSRKQKGILTNPWNYINETYVFDWNIVSDGY